MESTASDRKCQANRANAQKSTGPRSPEGKRRSSRNALKHGLLSSQVVRVSVETAKIVAALPQRYAPLPEEPPSAS